MKMKRCIKCNGVIALGFEDLYKLNDEKIKQCDIQREDGICDECYYKMKKGE